MNTLYFVAVNSLSVCIVAGIGVLKRYIVIGINFVINNKIIGTIQVGGLGQLLKYFYREGILKQILLQKKVKTDVGNQLNLVIVFVQG